MGGDIDGVPERSEVALASAEETIPTNAVPVWTPAPSGSHGPSGERDRSRAEATAAASTRLASVVPPGQEREEQADDLVSHELLDDRVRLEQHLARGSIEAVHQTSEVEDGHLPGELARASDVGEQHRELNLSTGDLAVLEGAWARLGVGL